MRRTVCGLLIVLFLGTMAALRWGPELMSGGRSGEYSLDRRGHTATVHLDGDIFADVGMIWVENRYGRVRVEATEGTPGWSWDLTCWANTPQLAQYYTRAIEMRVDQQPERSFWTLVMPTRRTPQLRGVESNLTLMVPASTKVHVRNRHGDTEILGVQGETRACCEHGKLELSDLKGNVDAETSYAPLSAERIPGAKLVNRHGSITATDVEGDLEVLAAYGQVEVHRVAGELKVNNQHGKVVASGIAGQAEIQTSYAEIQLEDVGGKTVLRNQRGRISGRRLRGNVDALNQYQGIDLDVNSAEVTCRNHYGDVQLRLADPALRFLRAETYHGDLELDVSESLLPKIEAQTAYGSVKSAFPVYAMGTGTDNFQGLDESIPRITLKTEHGSIRIKRSTQSGSSR